MPKAPPGMRILAHSKPNKRASWAFHGQSGWYIGPAPEHYRCVTFYMPKTHREIKTDMIRFVSNHIPIPETSIDDHIRNSLKDPTLILSNKVVSTFSSTMTSPTSRQALIQLASIFNRVSITQPPNPTYEGASYKNP